jgi:hypothetical protein
MASLLNRLCHICREADVIMGAWCVKTMIMVKGRFDHDVFAVLRERCPAVSSRGRVRLRGRAGSRRPRGPGPGRKPTPIVGYFAAHPEALRLP